MDKYIYVGQSVDKNGIDTETICRNIARLLGPTKDKINKRPDGCLLSSCVELYLRCIKYPDFPDILYKQVFYKLGVFSDEFKSKFRLLAH